MGVEASQHETSGKNYIYSVKTQNHPEHYRQRKIFFGTSSILARDKSRLLPTDPLFTRGMLAREMSYSLTFQQLDSRN